MILYAWKTRECLCRRDTSSRVDGGECGHGNRYRRDFSSVQLRPQAAFQPHYSYSVGRYVQTELEFRDALKQTADDNSEQAGTDHKYEYIDPADMKRMEGDLHTEVVEESIRTKEKLGVS